jgi:FkbM family methyltransferase
MSVLLASSLKSIINAAVWFRSATKRAKTLGLLIEELHTSLIIDVPTKHGAIKLFGGRSRYVAAEAMEFHQTEPELLEWLDSLKPGEHLWDIGAAVGLYSLYAAKRGLQVTAFEPKGMSFGTLVEHIAANGLGERIFPVCAALSDKTELDHLGLKDLIVGGTMNKLSGTTDQFGKDSTVFAQGIPKFRADDFVSVLGAKRPDHIKLDVDGVEGPILAGAGAILTSVRSALIEVEGENATHAAERIDGPLNRAGLFEDKAMRDKGSKRNRLFVRA